MGGFADFIDAVNERTGRIVSWLALAIVLVQFAVVVGRYVFGVGSVMAQESIVYMHGLLFMLASAYTLKANGHVRVDIFYGSASPRRKALVDFCGALFLLLPVVAMIYLLSTDYVARSWAIFEGSKETSGIQGIFLLKLAIPVFALQMYAQGTAMLSRTAAVLWGPANGDGAARFAQIAVFLVFAVPLGLLAAQEIWTVASGLAVLDDPQARVRPGQLLLAGIIAAIATGLVSGALVAARRPSPAP